MQKSKYTKIDNKYYRNILLFITALLTSTIFSSSIAQSDSEPIIGGKVGLSFNIGTKLNRIGLMAGVYGYKNFAQLNLVTYNYYCFNSWGPNRKKWESQFSIGATFACGKHREQNKFISATGNQTARPFAISFAYKWYTDNIESSQLTGIVALHFDHVSIISENDAFAGTGSDKFRTGGTSIIYTKDNWQGGINLLFWTGNPKHLKTNRIKGTKYPANYGYFDLKNAKYKEYSHGLLSLQLDHQFSWNQNARASIGIDAEQIRHAVQNKFMHDMVFIPDKWNSAENPHYPMIDENGKPYLFKEGQKIRKAKFFGNVSLNPSWFY